MSSENKKLKVPIIFHPSRLPFDDLTQDLQTDIIDVFC